MDVRVVVTTGNPDSVSGSGPSVGQESDATTNIPGNSNSQLTIISFKNLRPQLSFWDADSDTYDEFLGWGIPGRTMEDTQREFKQFTNSVSVGFHEKARCRWS